MEKVEGFWEEEIIYNIELECPYCGNDLDVDDLINQKIPPGFRIKDKKIKCPYCQKYFLANLYY